MLFLRDMRAAGFAVDEYIGRTFCGFAVILRDQTELARAIRSTSAPVGFEEFPTGGWLLFAK